MVGFKHVRTDEHTHTCTHVHTDTYLHPQPRTYPHTCTQTPTPTHMNTPHASIPTPTHKHANTHTHKQNIPERILHLFMYLRNNSSPNDMKSLGSLAPPPHSHPSCRKRGQRARGWGMGGGDYTHTRARGPRYTSMDLPLSKSGDYRHGLVNRD